MIINDELMDKFASIEDLPVSEELLGAYIEGNVSDYEAAEIEELMAYEPALADFVDDISMPDFDAYFDETIGMPIEDPDYFDPNPDSRYYDYQGYEGQDEGTESYGFEETTSDEDSFDLPDIPDLPI